MTNERFKIVADMVVELTKAKLEHTPHLNVKVYSAELMLALLEVNRQTPEDGDAGDIHLTLRESGL